MQFAQEIKRILLGTLVAFFIIAIGATYWSIVGATTVTQRDDNPRIIEDIIRIQRGSIYDRDDRLLAETIRNEDDVQRIYPYESTYSAMGYSSLRYGEGGVESAFNDILNGVADETNLETYFEREILDVAPIGSDIRLTLDIDIQNSLVSAIGEYRGAGVILNAQNGNILGLASLPTYNPNTLDEDWESLTEAEGNPFFNRALQGQYQPGGVMYTLWLSQAILTRYDTSQQIANANDAISLDENTLIECVIPPDESNLSLSQAYLFGCPVPFVVYSRTTAEGTYNDLIDTFALDNQIILPDFPVAEPISPTSGTQIAIEVDSELQLLSDKLGQGTITVTPLHVAEMMAAVANNGNAPQPSIQMSIRTPDNIEWQAIPTTRSSLPMLTSTTARQLRALMTTHWQTIQNQSYPENVTVGVNIAKSLSGDETQLWLIGFIRTEQSGHVAFVLLLEDTNDIQAMISIGQTLIQDLLTELSA